MADPLLGKVALPTGAASGIGRAIALRSAREGAIAVIAGVTETVRKGGGSTRAIPEREGRPVLFRRTDVSNEADAAIAAAVDRFGQLDILVNNAIGGARGGRLTDASLEQWTTTLAVGIAGVFLMGGGPGFARCVRCRAGPQPRAGSRDRVAAEVHPSPMDGAALIAGCGCLLVVRSLLSVADGSVNRPTKTKPSPQDRCRASRAAGMHERHP